MKEFKINLELEKRFGNNKIRCVLIKPQFVTLALGLNFTYKKKTKYNLWNIQINIFLYKKIISIIFNDPIRLEEQPYYKRGSSILNYFNED